MSAMLDTYDMQILDYSGDHDIQMHPSSSDQWFQDEAKMEEDGPTLVKHESDSHLKTDAYIQEKADINIEVDMEPFLDQQNEYDMVDDEEIHESGAEILDVEVYDVSHAQSPAMFAVDTVLEEASAFLHSFETPDLGSALNDGLPTEPLDSALELSDPHLDTSTSDEASHAHPESEVLTPVPHFETEPEATSNFEFAKPGVELSEPSVIPGPEVDGFDSIPVGSDEQQQEMKNFLQQKKRQRNPQKSCTQPRTTRTLGRI
ncbi:hypothetical protein BDZ97DRAFT_799370 [Flammula alnicola]|nr:hypothetical protein BDZ97DRAFT_799370 [Flammula alnicola]